MILVTGGSGYFGTSLVELLRDRGQAVRILDLREPDRDASDIECIVGDIRDASTVDRACQGVDTIYHCVAQVPLAKDKDLLWTVNREGTRNLLESAKTNNVRKVIYVSSSAVFGVPDEVPITPNTQPRPAEVYGAAKWEAERLCQDYIRQGTDVSIIRPRTIMGHGRLGIMQLVFEWIHEGSNVFVLGKGNNKFQFVHAADLADACLKAAERTGPAVYNIGAEIFGTMRETLEGLVEHAGTGSRVRSLPYGPTIAAMKLTSALRLSPLAAYHHLAYGRDIYFDIAKPKEDLDWQPQFSNIEMFKQSYDWYVEHRDEILQAKGRSPHRSAIKEGILKLLRWI
jgi:nucleoside-diphosphate-sugar epimerase